MMDWTDVGPMGFMMVVLALLTILLVVVLVLAINAMYPARGQGDSAQDRTPPAPDDPPATTRQ